ncbi:MAG: hypothetical protein FWC80_00865 [Firmicutes bacterium]|nr:hypothetical protein [Bacillota bacterium]
MENKSYCIETFFNNCAKKYFEEYCNYRLFQKNNLSEYSKSNYASMFKSQEQYEELGIRKALAYILEKISKMDLKWKEWFFDHFAILRCLEYYAIPNNKNVFNDDIINKTAFSFAIYKTRFLEKDELKKLYDNKTFLDLKELVIKPCSFFDT